jgi:maleamate amidohydrolase
VLDAARAAGIPVVYTKGDAGYRAACGGSVKNEDPERAKKLHTTPIADEIAPQDSEFVISKTKASAFFLTPLTIYLVRHGIDSLIVMGTATSGCVRATAVDGISHGYPVFVVSDGCFDRSQFMHDVTLYDLSTKYATVVTAAETIEYLKGGALKAAE